MLAERPHFLGYNAYFGDLHQHTGFSFHDGCGLPQEAITAAKARGNDFLAFTEHSSGLTRGWIGSIELGCRLTQVDWHKWETLQSLVDRYSQDGTFVLLRGYERTKEQGHINVFNSASMEPETDLDGFYSWLAAQPLDVIAQFNHPYPEELGGIGDFDGYLFFPPAAPKIRIAENDVYPPFSFYYPEAFAQGWQISPVGHSDGHIASAAGSRRYGIFAPSITRRNLIDALRSGRTFGNTDGQLAVALVAQDSVGNVQWMGTPTSLDRLTLHGYAADTGGDAIVSLELIGKSGVIASWQPNSNPAECTFTVNSVQPGDFFYLHVRDAKGSHGWSGSIVRPLYRRLQTNPAVLGFSCPVTSSSPLTGTFLLQANDGGDTAWQASSSAPWVTLSATNGEHLPALITVTVSPAGLGIGIHTTGITLRALQSGYGPVVVGVQTNVGNTTLPTFTASPRTVSLTATTEHPTVSGTVTLSSTEPALAWIASTSVPWLSLSPATGTGPGCLRFMADLAGYPMGTYTGHIITMAGTQVRVTEIRVTLQPRHARTLTLQQGLNGYGGTSDTYLNGSTTGQNTPAGREVNLYAYNAGVKVPLLKFSLPQVPTDTLVLTATLSLYAQQKTAQSVMFLNAYEVLQDWDEAAATWFVTGKGTAWAQPGASKKGVDIACQPVQTLIADPVGRWYTFDITPLVRKWIAEPSTNHGVAIVGEANAAMAFVFPSAQSLASQIALRPRLDMVLGDPNPTVTPTLTPEPSPTPTDTPQPSATPTDTPPPTATPTTTPSPSPGSVYLPLLEA